ncbi:MAG: VRR-NUC domain-containing protein, partial [Betaproteobacteria bacterium]|nr:VRR-NUC domain-containing protein [Betaproteobacteria bacterium]
MTPEAKVKAAIRKVLDALAPDLWYFMPAMNGYGKRGVPDFVGCYHGKFFAIEAKSVTGAVTPWQERTLHDIVEAGGKA